MEFNFLLILVFVSAIAVAGTCHASVPGDVYWNSVFPNSPMPKNLRNLLHPDVNAVNTEASDTDEKPSSFLYSLDENGYVVAYFFEHDLVEGKQTVIPHLMKTNGETHFLPRESADSIPFSTAEFPKILKYFSVEPSSLQAKFMKRTIDDCEAAAVKGEDKFCVTSLESLVESSVSRLGKQIQILPNEIEKATKVKEFVLGEGVEKIVGNQVVCHRTHYPYAVFLCHSLEETDAYSVPLTGLDGTKGKGVAICHKDTSGWNPKHLAFRQLHVEPGSVPICHFLTVETVVWVLK